MLLLFRFEFKESAIGQYLSSIDDHKDGPAGYWMIYRLPSGREMSDSDGREALQKYLLTTSEFRLSFVFEKQLNSSFQ